MEEGDERCKGTSLVKEGKKGLNLHGLFFFFFFFITPLLSVLLPLLTELGLLH